MLLLHGQVFRPAVSRTLQLQYCKQLLNPQFQKRCRIWVFSLSSAECTSSFKEASAFMLIKSQVPLASYVCLQCFGNKMSSVIRAEVLQQWCHFQFWLITGHLCVHYCRPCYVDTVAAMKCFSTKCCLQYANRFADMRQKKKTFDSRDHYHHSWQCYWRRFVRNAYKKGLSCDGIY